MPESVSRVIESAGVRAYPLSFGGYRAEVVSRGAALRLLECDGRALTETWSAQERPPLSAGLVLAPWPNRLRDGHFVFDGVEHQLSITEPDRHNAIHGLVRRDEWQLVERTESSVEQTIRVGLHKGWPYPLQVGVRHELGPDGLTVTHTATNIGAMPAPFGLGVHTYVRVGDTPLDDCTLQLTAGTRLPLDPDRMLPEGNSQSVYGTEFDFTSPRDLAGVRLDTPFSSIVPDPDGRARHVLRAPDGAGTVLWTDRRFGWIQVFTADPETGKGYPGRGRALAVEPMTCPPDAFNSGIDQLVLAPGQTWSGSWGLGIC
ncbi:aldose 1-epimerase family protein [Rhodococcus tukisamuensis]|uniref:Aldose 1-epimerase n=1 Tax=Rhodococcus tukisamuensis TaxID=168276 RepID=A0A1G6P7U7_9NOCA|nr:aldose 1-epimerase family protein [Rhodococcus tukisamuensis]SDC76031.1 aldose 1-epimerase [Rhodococcus tukisamuensis]